VGFRIICAGGFKLAMQAIAPAFTASTGTAVELSFGTPARTREVVSSGEGFDLAVVTLGSLDEAASAQLDPTGRFTVAKSPVGMGVRAGLAAGTIASVEDFAAVIRSLPTVGLSNPKAGTNLGNDIMAAADRLGFGEDLRQRAVFVMGPGSMVSAEVAKGAPDAVITLMSEIINIEGVRFLGPVPDTMGLGTPFVAAKASGTTAAQEADPFLEFLKSSPARQMMVDSGLTVF
jgi:molybdate transport system substrate-binding protein